MIGGVAGLLIGALGCLVVYLSGPHRMVWIALFLAFASLPASLHVGKVIGPVSVYAYQAAVLLAIAFLIPAARLRLSRYGLPIVLALTVMFFAAVGVAAGHDPQQVAREASFLCEVIAGFVLALLIVRTGHVAQSIRVMAVVLWFSAVMIVVSSLTGLRLAGRAESLQGETGTMAIRLLTSTQAPALAVLTALVAAQIVGRARLSAWFVLGTPALAITLLSFARNTLIALAVTALVALVAAAGWAAIRRSAVLAAAGAVAVAVVIPTALFALHQTGPGIWLADQLNAFSHRVIGGISTTALASDPSTLARVHENANLWHAFGDAPLLGHGLGYAYQLPFGEPGTFTATLGTTYAHNFYLWWLVKAGVAGMAVFAVFALTPVTLGVRSTSAAAKISAAVSAGLLAICVVDPLPLEPASSLVLGLGLGAAIAFATRESPSTQPVVSPAPTTAPSVAHTSG
jgi:O-antigen ligase